MRRMLATALALVLVAALAAPLGAQPQSFAPVPASGVVLYSGASISATPPPSQMAGTQIVFTGSATCPNPRYQFLMRPASQSSWQTVQAYSSSPTYNWNSTGAATGTIYFGVWAKDASSSALYDAVTSIPFVITMSWPDKAITYTADAATINVQRRIWNWERLATALGVEMMRNSQFALRMPGCSNLRPTAMYKIANPRTTAAIAKIRAPKG